MMVDLCNTFSEQLSDHRLFAWHRMLMNGRQDLVDVGRYRTCAGSMQVVSGPIGLPRIYFEAPPSVKVPSETGRSIEWFNQTTPAGNGEQQSRTADRSY